MNNEDFYSADFTNSLPPALKNDPDMMTLAQTISAQLQTTAAEVRKNIIYARIDELDEATLDVLAYDLHVDWYDYSYRGKAPDHSGQHTGPPQIGNEVCC